MGPLRWMTVLLVVLSAVVEAGGRPPKAKPKSARYLGKTKLWYMLHVPERYNPNEAYPLVVVQPYRDDYADASFRAWEEQARQDRVFLTSLNFPPGTKDKRDERLIELIRTLLKQYRNIDRRRLIHLGVGPGATKVIRFAVERPHIFAANLALAPRSFPSKDHLKELNSGRRARHTPLCVSVDPKDRDPKYLDQLQHFKDTMRYYRRLGFDLRVFPAPAEGSGKPSPQEEERAVSVIRGFYPRAKREALVAMARKAAAEARKKKEDEKHKHPATKEPVEGPGPKTPKPAHEKLDPDAVFLKAQDAYDKGNYVEALKLFRKLAALKDNATYARLAQERVKQIEQDPAVRRTIADQEAAPKCRSWLQLARSYASNERTRSLAVAQYRRIISTFPDSSFAETARKELKKLLEKQ